MSGVEADEGKDYDERATRAVAYRSRSSSKDISSPAIDAEHDTAERAAVGVCESVPVISCPGCAYSSGIYRVRHALRARVAGVTRAELLQVAVLDQSMTFGKRAVGVGQPAHAADQTLAHMYQTAMHVPCGRNRSGVIGASRRRN